jgi:hypothetical protein
LIAVLVLLAACIALAGYLVHLKRLSDQRQQRLAQVSPIEAPPQANTRTATLIVADDSSGKLVPRKAELAAGSDVGEQIRSELRALFTIYRAPDSPHGFSKEADIRDVYVLGSDAVVIDTNAAFAAAYPNNARREELTIESMVRTIAANHPEIRRVKMLVDGRERDTMAGNVSLREFFVASPQFTVRSSQ